MYIVYRAFGKLSSLSYYGYQKGEEKEEVLLEVLSDAKRPDRKDSGISKLFVLNNEDESTFDVEIIEVCTDELEAFISRNEQRVSNYDSITGPTPWPMTMSRRAESEKPETMEQHRKRMKQRGAKTARQAYSLGLWTKSVIDNLVSWSTDKPQLKKDFDKLSPDEFAIKYSI